MAWNTGEHRRKFRVAPGHWLDSDQGTGKAELVFWGEWEPPSRVERSCPPRAGCLERSTVPLLGGATRQRVSAEHHPWVFGDRMIYSVCKTDRRATEAPSDLHAAADARVGDLLWLDHQRGVLRRHRVRRRLGGTLGFRPTSLSSISTRHSRRCTGRSVASREGDAHRSLTLYRGATADEPVEGMFSFVPARRADLDDPRFLRPPVESKFINPASQQSPRGSKCALPMETLRGTWDGLREQILDAGLLLATWLKTRIARKSR